MHLMMPRWHTLWPVAVRVVPGPRAGNHGLGQLPLARAAPPRPLVSSCRPGGRGAHRPAVAGPRLPARDSDQRWQQLAYGVEWSFKA